MSIFNRKQTMLIFLIFLITGSAVVYGDTNVSGSISSDTTWGAPETTYIVTGDVTVTSAATLTVEAGVEVRFNQNTRLYVGGSGTPSEEGTLICDGTEASPVVFTSNQATPAAGDWYNLYFRENSDASSLTWTEIEYGGGSDNASVYLDGSDATFLNCTISDSSTYGIYATNAAPSIGSGTIMDTGYSNVYFNNCAGDLTDNDIYGANPGRTAVIMNGACTTDITGNSIDNTDANYGLNCDDASTAPTITGNVFTGNSIYPVHIYARNLSKLGLPLNSYQYDASDKTIRNRIYVVGDTVSEDSTWHDQGTPYFIAGDITVSGQDGEDDLTTLTVEDGAEFHFNAQTGLYIGSNTETSPGALVASGTSGDRIVFTSTEESHGYWDGIRFYDYSDDTICLMEYCDVFYGGYDDQENIYCEQSSPAFNDCRFFYGLSRCFYSGSGSNPVLQNCEIAYANGYGLYCVSGGNAQLSACDIHDNTSHGIYVNSSADLTADTGTTIQDNLSHGVYIRNSSHASLTDVTISGNNWGIYCHGGGDSLDADSCAINSNLNYPVYIYASQVGGITNCTYSDNQYQYIYVNGNTIDADSLWEGSIPYRVVSDITVRGTDGADSVTTLTLDAGAELHFNEQIQLFVGHDDSASYPGGLTANGTDAEPVLFTAYGSNPTPGWWDGIYFSPYSDDANCILEYAEVYYGGYSSFESIQINNASPTLTHCGVFYGTGPNIYAYNGSAPVISWCESAYSSSQGIQINSASNANISNCDLHDNSSYGIYVGGDSSATIADCVFTSNNYGIYCNGGDDVALISGCEFIDNSNYPIRIYAAHVGSISGCTCTSGDNPEIYIVGDTVDLDSVWAPDIPFFITGDVTVQGKDGADEVTTLTLEAGAELRFGSQDRLTIGHDSNDDYPGALNAVGTSSEMITFTARTDFPSPGYWDGIYFSHYSDDSMCLMEYCRIEYGGYSSDRNIYCNNSSPTLRHCEIFHGANANVYSYNQSNPVLENCEIAYSNSYGIDCNSNADAQLTDCNVHDNDGIGVYVRNTSHVALTDCTVADNSWGLYCNSNPDAADATGCTFYHNNNYPVRMYASQITGITNCIHDDNVNQKFYVEGETISVDTTWANQGIPYYVDTSNHIYVRGKDGADQLTTWTIEAGAEIQMDNNRLIYISHNSNSNLPGALRVLGTAAEPVKFTTDELMPEPGDWYGIYFAAYTDDAATILDHCIIEYGGYTGDYENVQCYNSSPVLNNCEIRYGEGYGVRAYTNSANPTLNNCHIHDNTSRGVEANPGAVQIIGGLIENNGSYGVYVNEGTSGAPTTLLDGVKVTENNQYGIYVNGGNSTPVIKNCIIAENNSGLDGYGIYINNSAMPVIGADEGGKAGAGGNDFYGHYDYAVYNNTGSTCVSAQYNYWGAPGGPNDTDFDDDGCMNDGNDNPAAERVSDDVDYSNWADGLFTPTPLFTPGPEPTATPGPCIKDGDVNDDGMVSMNDAQLTFMIVLGAYTPTYEEECAADCNGDGDVTISDAQCMYQFFLGMGCECVDPATGSNAFHKDQATLLGEAASDRQKLIELTEEKLRQIKNEAAIEDVFSTNAVWIQDISACGEEVVSFDVWIHNAETDLDSFGFSMEYPSDMLQFIGFENNRDFDDWTMFGCREIEPGFIRSAGFTIPRDALPEDSRIRLLTMRFRIRHEALQIGDACELIFTELFDDMAEWTGFSGTFAYCELLPDDSWESLIGTKVTVPKKNSLNSDQTISNQ